MNQPPSIISDLINKFERNIDEYRNPKYNETQIRIEFVNPFWKALGWDVDNEKGYALNYRDVIHEDELKIGRTTRAPDYAFRIGGRRIFFLETKKPALDLKHDSAPAFQLRRYAYSAKLPVSLLTDFEELIVYDCRLKPAITDKPHVGRMMYYSFHDYVKKWQEISNIFSREAVMQGAFDRFIEGTQGKRPRAEIDRDFLNDLDRWRIELARNIALRNPQLTERELNYAVQLTIDRLIFLRMCEDRDIEQYETLMALLNGNQLYRRLVSLYYKADERYNSGLFHFEEKDGANPDLLTPKLAVDDKVLRDIISELYYPQCPYEFSVLPVEVLGNAYEQFLGKRISLTEGHRARIEEKPEVRKAGGVYYTPQYIVDYIVKNTVGKLCEGKTPREISELRFLDPACGSGSFLLGAYQYLLNWHLEWYRSEMERTGEVPQSAERLAHSESRERDRQRKAKSQKRKAETQAIFQGKGSEWYLTTAEKKRILLNNIYGVDIDANAVEVTKLSLLLKVLEHETSETLNQQLGLWKERALPNLDSNIKCGNSLIGTDFYEGRQAGLFNQEEALRINAFDWDREFPEIFARGGFDAVIGNPPYGATLSPEIKRYLSKHFPIVSDFESSQYFIAMSEKITKQEGFVAFIVPNTLFLNLFAQKFRYFISSSFCILKIANLSQVDVFTNATVRTIIPVLRKNKSKNHAVEIVEFENDQTKKLCGTLNQVALCIDDKLWFTGLGSATDPLREKIHKKSIRLGDILQVSQGLIPYDKYRGHDEYTIKNRIWHSDKKKDKTYKRELRGGDVKRYSVSWNGKQWISYGNWLAAPRKPEFFIKPRLLFREITDPKSGLLHVAYTNEEYYNNPGIINCISEDRAYSLLYVLGLCASHLMAFFHFSS